MDNLLPHLSVTRKSFQHCVFFPLFRLVIFERVKTSRWPLISFLLLASFFSDWCRIANAIYFHIFLNFGVDCLSAWLVIFVSCDLFFSTCYRSKPHKLIFIGFHAWCDLIRLCAYYVCAFNVSWFWCSSFWIENCLNVKRKVASKNEVDSNDNGKGNGIGNNNH